MALVVRPKAVKDLASVPRAERERLLERLERIAKDPYGNNPDAKRLQGTPGFSVRQGTWRAVYRLDGAVNVVVIAVKHRREVYRR